jgi:3-hydroxypropanoate dehydrogenase
MSIAAPTLPPKEARALDDAALRTLFLDARSANGFLARPIPPEVVQRLVELAQLGPTSANTNPLRLVLVETREGKERLRPHLSPGNVEKTMSAPLTVIVAADTRFYEHLPTLFPHKPEMRERFAGEENAELARRVATQGATLGAAYLIVAARALGLDAGPMGGFERAGVDREFLAGTGWESVMLVNLGYGDDTKLFPRLPRLAPETVTLRV